LVHVPTTRADHVAVGVLARFDDDVDHSVHRIGPPNGSSGSTDDFDPVNILQGQILDLPKSPGQQSGIDTASVNHDEYVPGKPASETSNSDGPAIAVNAGNLDARSEPQSFWNGCCSRTLDVLLSDHIDRRRRAPRLFGSFGHGGDLHIRELLERHLLERDLLMRQFGGTGHAPRCQKQTGQDAST
jgi:hypothetical protein